MVILRKSDSTTSIILFIYNNYLNEYDKDTLKLSSLLQILKVFGKSEAATRMSLSRTVKAGILINKNIDRDVYYSLAPFGKEAILEWNMEMDQFWRRYALRNEQWDKKWYLLNINFSENHKEFKGKITKALNRIGLELLSTNTWISPYNQSDEVQKTIEDYDLKNIIVEMCGEIKIKPDMYYLIQNVYHYKDLERSYLKFIEKCEKEYGEVKKVYTDKNFIEEGASLPLLHSLGWEFISIASKDVCLPEELYPKWAGDDAALLMKNYRGILLEATKRYLKKFK